MESIPVNIVLQKTEMKYWVDSPFLFAIVPVIVALVFPIFKGSGERYLQNVCSQLGSHFVQSSPLKS